MSVKRLLNDEIVSEIENLNKVPLGSEEHKIAADALAKLLDKSIEMDKLDLEYQDKADSREAANNLKRIEIEEEKKDRQKGKERKKGRKKKRKERKELCM